VWCGLWCSRFLLRFTKLGGSILEGEKSTRSFKLKDSQSAYPNHIPKERDSKHQESANTQETLQK